MTQEAEEYITVLKDKIQTLELEKKILESRLQEYQARIRFLVTQIADPERKNDNMHMWQCPKCEVIYLDEPVKCHTCGYDNLGN